jgi:hypothetical protein
MKDIKRRLGYCFVFQQVVLPIKVSPDLPVLFIIRLENSVFASPFNLRPLKMGLCNKKSRKE